MGIPSDLTYGQKSNMRHNVEHFERYGNIFLECFETVRRTAPAIAVGLEDEYSTVSKLILAVKERWQYYQVHDEWPDVNGTKPKATK